MLTWLTCLKMLVIVVVVVFLRNISNAVRILAVSQVGNFLYAAARMQI